MRYYPRKLLATIIAAIATIAMLIPTMGQAQAARRWVADPGLIAQAKMIGPSVTQTTDTIIDIEMISQNDGWAVSYANLLRYDGQFWRQPYGLAPTTTLSAVDFATPDEGWVVGSDTQRIPPYTASVLIGRVDPRTNSYITVPVTKKDGSTSESSLLFGNLNDIAAFPGSAIAVGGVPSDVEFWQRPLVLAYDAGQWRDVTPDGWRYGYLSQISMVSPTEGWASGLFGRPGGAGDDVVRGVILHYQNGQWTEQALPQLPTSGQPFSLPQLLMTNAGEGWAVFQDAGTSCGNARLLHYQGGSWSLVDHEYASSLKLGLISGTNRGWLSLGGCSGRGTNRRAQRMHFDGGALTPDTSGAMLIPGVYGLLSDDVQIAASGGSFMRYAAGPLPTDRVAGAPTGARYFAETGHTLTGEFRSYYQSHGLDLGDPGLSDRESLALFGFPVSEPFVEVNPDTGKVLTVQYFERARMELHPENPQPYRVLLGRLAASAMLRRSHQAVETPDQTPTGPGCARFEETGHQLCAPLRGFWDRSGGLAVFGFPITIARDEQSATDGKTYPTQWFERERLEYHPELAGTPYEVLLGLMGSEELRVRGYLQ